MGAWSEGLYGNDMACDVRSALKLLSKLDWSADRMVAALMREFKVRPLPAGAEPEDDSADFWLAVSEGLHRLGLESDIARDQARALLDGADLARWHRLGAAPASLRRRARVLERLAGQLATPAAAAPRRRVQTEPDPILADIGEAICIEAQDGESRLWHAVDPAAATFVPDGWLTGVVLDRGHTFGMFAWYLTAQLDLLTPGPPTIEQVRASSAALFAPGRLSRRLLARSGAQSRGVLPLDCDGLIRSARAGQRRGMLEGPDVFSGWTLFSRRFTFPRPPKRFALAPHWSG